MEGRVSFEFIVDDEGLVDVAIGDDLPILADALQDSVGSRPPRDAPQDGPSTYWVDSALTGLRARLEDAGEEPFTSGNETYLQLKEGLVEARYDYDAADSPYVDAVPADELLHLLEAWRRRILEESPAADKRMPPPPTAKAMPPPA